MAISIAKLAPTAVVLAAVGYCSWPYMDQKTSSIKAEEAKLPEIPAAHLTPEIVLNTKRDPFGNSVPVEMGITRNKDEKKDKGKKDDKGTGKSKTANGKNDKGTATPAAKPKTVISIDTTKMVLNATLLRGERHVAVINGQSYSETDKLIQPEHPGHPITVAKVFTNRVVLQRDGQSVELLSARLFDKEDHPASSSGGGGLFNLFSTGTKAAPTGPPKKSTSFVRLSRPLQKKAPQAQPSSMKAAPKS